MTDEAPKTAPDLHGFAVPQEYLDACIDPIGLSAQLAECRRWQKDPVKARGPIDVSNFATWRLQANFMAVAASFHASSPLDVLKQNSAVTTACVNFLAPYLADYIVRGGQPSRFLDMIAQRLLEQGLAMAERANKAAKGGAGA